MEHEAEMDLSLKLDVLQSIAMDLQAITEEQLEYHGSHKLDNSARGETRIGFVTDRTTKALNFMALRYLSQAKAKDAEAEQADSPEKEKESKAEAARFRCFADTVRHLFWMEVHSQLAHWDSNIAVRKGWQIVTTPDEEDGGIPPALKRLLGGLGQ